MSIKTSAEDAGWTIREAAWGVEERVLWRGSDAARASVRRALRPLQPLQRWIQTRIAWPVTDAWRKGGVLARASLAALAVATLAAAAVGATTITFSSDSPAPAAVPATSAAPGAGGAEPSLAGVAPDFNATSTATTVEAQKAEPAAAHKAAAAQPPAGRQQPAAEPAEAAWRFAQALVQYEVGEVSEQTTATFGAVAEPPLAQALAADPPRLPTAKKVPRAQVLNVVLGERKGKELEASVSLLRLQAASELRLTLRQTPDGWRVAEVRG